MIFPYNAFLLWRLTLQVTPSQIQPDTAPIQSLQGLQADKDPQSQIQLSLTPDDYVLEFEGENTFYDCVSVFSHKFKKNSLFWRCIDWCAIENNCLLGIVEDDVDEDDSLGGWTFGQVFLKVRQRNGLSMTNVPWGCCSLLLLLPRLTWPYLTGKGFPYTFNFLISSAFCLLGML